MPHFKERLKGKQFKYISPYSGLSEWTDTVYSVIIRNISQRPKKGYKIEIIITGNHTGGMIHYPLDRVVFEL